MVPIWLRFSRETQQSPPNGLRFESTTMLTARTATLLTLIAIMALTGLVAAQPPQNNSNAAFPTCPGIFCDFECIQHTTLTVILQSTDGQVHTN